MSSHKSGSCATLVVQGLGLNITQKYDCNMAFDLSEGKYNIYVSIHSRVQWRFLFLCQMSWWDGVLSRVFRSFNTFEGYYPKDITLQNFWFDFTLIFSSTHFVCRWNRVELCVSNLELGFQCTIEHQFSSWLEANHDFCAKALLSTINYSSLCWHLIGRAASGGGLPLVEEAKFKVAAAAVQWRKAHQRYILLAN